MVFELKGSLFTEKYKIQLKNLFSAALSKRGYLKFELSEIRNKLASLSISLDEAEIAYEYYIKDSARIPLQNKALVCDEILDSDLTVSIPVLTPDDAVNLMMAPFEIWLENGRADREFLLCVVDNTLKEELTKREKSSALHIDGKGGIGELKMSITTNQRPLIERNKLFVLMDSDCRVPGKLHQAAIDLKNVCESRNIHYHCLNRRMIENYLPTQFLESELSRCSNEKSLHDKLRLFNQLSLEQRSCFHFKKGFTRSSNDKELYSNLSTKVLNGLHNGFGKDISRFFSDEKWKTSVGQEIRKSESPDEAKEILNKIKRVIRVPA